MVKKIIYIDVDNTVCTTPKIDNAYDYNKSTPILENIEKANKLYEKGHEIVYWTARGSATGLDWKDLTKTQLAEWGCKFTRIETLKKPAFDLLIDDKCINTSKWIDDIDESF